MRGRGCRGCRHDLRTVDVAIRALLRALDRPEGAAVSPDLWREVMQARVLAPLSNIERRLDSVPVPRHHAAQPMMSARSVGTLMPRERQPLTPLRAPLPFVVRLGVLRDADLFAPLRSLAARAGVCRTTLETTHRLDAAGRVELTLSLSPAGALTDADASPANGHWVRCLVNAARAIPMPRPLDGHPARVSVAFTL